MKISTCDLSDEFEDDVQPVVVHFNDYGGVTAFGGEIVTLRAFEDNSLVREEVHRDGAGKVLVVDGGASMRYSLVGDQVAQLACDHGWTGLIVNGVIRDSVEVGKIAIGVKALGTIPRRSRKEGKGFRQVPLFFGSVAFQPGEYVYADEDGILIAPRNILKESKGVD